MMTVKELIQFAIRVLGSVAKARAWMDTPHVRFGGSPGGLAGLRGRSIEGKGGLESDGRGPASPDSGYQVCMVGQEEPLT
jgi:hypothetical protein